MSKTYVRAGVSSPGLLRHWYPMSSLRHTVLTDVVDRYERSGDPVTARDLAGSVDATRAALDRTLESLHDLELLERTAGGYRPTTTADELFALDAEFDDVLVLDPVDETGRDSPDG